MNLISMNGFDRIVSIEMFEHVRNYHPIKIAAVVSKMGSYLFMFCHHIQCIPLSV
jgi:cyclopropane fatty-acyl-phospholipid synthase-like methyltransferase